jgi:putative spermidine/putrescine transport system substrate-binding protein
MILSRRHAALGALALPAILPARAQAPRFRGREIVATSFGSPGQDVHQREVYAPLERETGARGSQTTLFSAQAFARMRAEAANPQVDLFLFSGGQEAVAKAEGLSQPIPRRANWDAIPAALKDPDGHWIAWGIIAEGILYRTDRVANPPTSYRDFFRPELQGHIAFPHISNGYGMDFLVMLARTHGGSETNIEPGFEAIRRIAPRASIFRAATDVQTLFAQGDVWMMPYDNASAVRTARMGLPVAFAAPTEGAPAVLLTAAVARRSRNADIAGEVVDRMLGAGAQTAIATEVAWGPSNPTVTLPEAVARTVARPDQVVQLDRDAINAARAAWTDRYNREVSR